MRFLALALFASPILALTITSPTGSSTINPSQDFTITWTSTSSDPSTLSFVVHETNSAVLAADETVASGIATSLGTFTVPADTLQEFGTGFVVQALSGGNVIAQSGVFALAAGANNVQTLSNGQQTFVSVSTAAPAATATTAATAATTTAASAGVPATSDTFFDTATTSTNTVLSFLTNSSLNTPSTAFGFPSSSGLSSVTTKGAATLSTSTASSTSTSSGLAGNVQVGVAGLLGGLMGAVALLV